MKKRFKTIVGLTLCASVLFFQGCTKEKAEAIKVAAQNFQAQASTALNQIGDILRQNVAVPPKDNEALVKDRMQLKPDLEKLLEHYAKYQMRLLDEGIFTTDTDLAEMGRIKKGIDDAAQRQELAVAIARTIAFVATKTA